MDVLGLDYDFAALSLKDLLEARDTYHYHLLSKANVVGTAVGYYLIRKDEAWPGKKGEGRSPAVKKSYGTNTSKFACVGYCFGAPYVCNELKG